MDGPQIHQISNPCAAVLDVVFIHGLGGGHPSTWTSGGGFWLEWIAEDIPEVAVSSLAYPAGVSRWIGSGTEMGINERAQNLLTLLATDGFGERPILFVCHSLGGLIVKAILRIANETGQDADVVESVRGVVFIATPHTGSRLANVGRWIWLARISPVVRALSTDTKLQRALSSYYRRHASKENLYTAAYAEHIRVLGPWVVHPRSADPGIASCVPVPIDADHIAICKPEGRSSLIHKSLLADIAAVMKAEDLGTIDTRSRILQAGVPSDDKPSTPRPKSSSKRLALMLGALVLLIGAVFGLMRLPGDDGPTVVETTLGTCDWEAAMSEAQALIAERALNAVWEDPDHDCLHTNYERHIVGTDFLDPSSPALCSVCDPEPIAVQLPHFRDPDCASIETAQGQQLGSPTVHACYLENNNLAGANFGGGDLRGLSVNHGVHDLVRFSSTNLQRASFRSGNWREADFSFADLTDSTFADLDLSGVSFDQAIIEGATFSNIECRDAPVDWGAPVGDARFVGANRGCGEPG